ncbi:MAG: PA2169 family four-helix-bundle protein [Burkholderiales bacterium]|nr:PA2169 family four-helix-bundle protein [Bacteroidia bacterium]
METTEKTNTAVRDLVIINNDRTEGYKTAATETKEADLKALFNRYSEQSMGFASELKQFITDADDMPKSDETKNTGKLYRVWMDVKAAITANNRKAVLSSCEFGEDKAKQTYDDVLKNTEGLASNIINIITKQKAELQKAHDEVKALRDSCK